jgi:DNA-binding transcriptional MerR regulator
VSWRRLGSDRTRKSPRGLRGLFTAQSGCAASVREVDSIALQCYTTKEIADRIGVHVNTVRFYEETGFMTKPERKANGYRIYTDLQLAQCRLIRTAMRAEVLQNGLRKGAVTIVRLCAAQAYDAALCAVDAYRTMIAREICNARAAISSVKGMIERETPTETLPLTRREAAAALCVTVETLRTWERSGLLHVRRRENGYRVYSAADMERLNIIRTLRCADFSLTAILRLLNGLDRNGCRSVEESLDTPQGDEEIVSACDRLISSLQSTAADAEAMEKMLKQMRKKFSTLQ